jgi:hypothetical protein
LKTVPALVLLLIAALSGVSVANPAESDWNPARERDWARRETAGDSPPSVAETLKLWNFS